MGRPIAKYSIVPNQRINTAFKAGVVAFAKDGVSNVSFAISGQGYSGTTPLTSSSMTLNDRTGVYEYWVTLDSGDFSSNGLFTIVATVTDTNSVTYVMPSLSLMVSTATQYEAWVSTTGSNTTGTVGNSSLPYATIPGAMADLQTANSGSADGCTIYLQEGTYNIGAGTTTTSQEWVTLTRASGTSKDNVIVNDSSSITSTTFFKAKGISITSTAQWDYFFSGTTNLWIDDCKITGCGRYVSGSNPTSVGSSDIAYYTDSTVYDADYGVYHSTLARGMEIEHIGNDSFVNTQCVLNCTVTDVDPGTTGWHADCYQAWGTTGMQDRLIFGLHGTDLHYQGLFLRGDTTHQNCAFVNLFLEMRADGLTTASFNGDFENVLVWHCTFLTSHTSFIAEAVPASFSLNDCSFRANMFYEYRDYATAGSSDPTYAAPGNTEDNDFIENHYEWSAVDTGGGGTSEPHWYSKSPDSVTGGSQSIGDPGIDMVTSSSTFGYPETGSVLKDRVEGRIVPIDVFGTARKSTSDVGAIEIAAESSGSYVAFLK